MLDLLFYIFAAVTLISAVLMVLLPNAVNGAMCMIVSFLGTAGLFVLLEAYFLAIIQVLVYAGAVMVLFLFIIMLLDVEKEGGVIEYKHKLTTGASVIGFALVTMLVCSLFSGGYLPEPELLPVLENPVEFENGVPFTTSSKSFGYSLFTKYMLPFQVTGFLLLSAMIGVIVVSKRPKELES
ncbi:MAG: NADH-quinone oxidoreductase subunit J [Lentimonas sp.]|jgi:NADH-quinone oxidoreductase subunit J